MSDKIRITVEGPTNSGKTFLLTAIQNLLEGAGHENVEWEDPVHYGLAVRQHQNSTQEEFMPDRDTEFELVERNHSRGKGSQRSMLEIPISDAESIAKSRGYDQIIIIGRRVGEAPDPHGEHVTTYGIDKENCNAAAKIGDYLKFEVMKWDRKDTVIYEDRRDEI